ncbi:carboxyl transferase domain-containing protein [Hydrogenophaga sp.]|uniref:carboxyl transferase domain-containing protein n=1 Tax=Hydrogenophaga sp. TaxID=1904254 RepID=UPI002D1FB748|nr:carboxyl transferase domain-containing protein [Hydrogenophaga sp.]
MRAPMQSQVVQCLVRPGESVRRDQVLLVLEAMKMEHELRAPADATIAACLAAEGDQVETGQVLIRLEQGRLAPPPLPPVTQAAAVPVPARADLERLLARRAGTLDAARPEAMARRHAAGMRSARENVADLCDEGSFIEYGALAVAAQSRRRSEAELIAQTPADGMVTGIGSVDACLWGEAASRTVVMAYDATVLAGTQGARNHQKTDRLLGIALSRRLPVVLFAEGGGGRPGDTDMPIVAGLHVPTFAAMARLSGQVPLVGVAAGRCFAGNAALLGCCDVIIATANSNIGLGGPAMIEGGGLGVFRPEEVGPSDVQSASGVIDVLVADEAAAVKVTRQYLGYFRGRLAGGQAPDARMLRDVVPENRVRSYDSRRAMEGLADTGSLLMLRSGFGIGIHTALGRIDGRPVGLMASNPEHLGGAIDAPAADKAARFLQLCDAHGLPVVSLVDTPGFMVGPDSEARAHVRHASRLFVVAAALRVPMFTVVLRKGYGLGAMGMAAGGFHATSFTIAWPSAEFGAMGLEGAVRLGYRKELEALPEGPVRQARFDALLRQHVEGGSAERMAACLEIDAVIDPAETRDWLLRGLQACPDPSALASRRFVDPW